MCCYGTVCSIVSPCDNIKEYVAVCTYINVRNVVQIHTVVGADRGN